MKLVIELWTILLDSSKLFKQPQFGDQINRVLHLFFLSLLETNVQD